MKNNVKSSHRKFIAKTGLVTAGVALGATGLNAANYNRIIGVNDRVYMGFIGIVLQTCFVTLLIA